MLKPQPISENILFEESFSHRKQLTRRSEVVIDKPQERTTVPRRKSAAPSQVPDLSRSCPVVVVASIVVGDRGVHQFIYIHVVQARDANGVELSGEVRRF